jgi:hypothetical protein
MPTRLSYYLMRKLHLEHCTATYNTNNISLLVQLLLHPGHSYETYESGCVDMGLNEHGISADGPTMHWVGLETLNIMMDIMMGWCGNNGKEWSIQQSR